MSFLFDNWQYLFAVTVIALFGYQQFNRWTDSETQNESTDVELLAFAPPRSFTTFWRFVSIAAFYCLCLGILFFVLTAVLSNSSYSSIESLKIAGVNEKNAWLIALFIVTGLMPSVPIFSGIERALRKVMHSWAVVPNKAYQLADELAASSTMFRFDEALFRDKVLPRLGPPFERQDFVEDSTATIAQKWVRLKWLVYRYGGPLLDDENADTKLHSPYTIRVRKDLLSLKRDIEAFAASNPSLLRSSSNTPAAVALADRIDSVQYRLFVLMSCQAYGENGDVTQHFLTVYGIEVRSAESLPQDPMFDALFALTATVLLISTLFGRSEAGNWPVHPAIWAANAFAVHWVGLVVGWNVFRRRRRHSVAANYSHLPVPVSRELLITCGVLAFVLATVPNFATAVYYEHSDNTATGVGMLLKALSNSWPWSLLGSATAIAVFIHLERYASREPDLSFRLKSAAIQCLANLGVATVIVGMRPSTHLGSDEFWRALSTPIYLLAFALTGAMGLVLGYLLPRIVHGHGPDLRGGAERCAPTLEAAQAMLSYGGRLMPVEIREISLTGCLLRVPGYANLNKGKHGTLTLSDGTVLSSYVVRQRVQTSSDDFVGPLALLCAMQFAARYHHAEMRKETRKRLKAFIGMPGFTVVA